MASSFAPSFGGMVSLSAGSKHHGRKHQGPMEKPSKESYALALEEQIAARQARRDACEDAFSQLACGPIGGDWLVSPSKPSAAGGKPPAGVAARMMGQKVGNSEQPPSPSERIMGQRHGGPMAPSCKESYALELRQQIEMKEARRAAENRAASVPAVRSDVFAGNEERADVANVLGLGKGKRCVLSAPSSKDSYALALLEQMAEKKGRAVFKAQQPEEFTGDVPFVANDAPSKARGRRHGAPPSMPKEAYALELREQMEDKATAARDVQFAAARLPPTGQSLAIGGEKEQPSSARGRRHETVIENNLGAYNRALQEQMAERASRRAASAHHRQASPGDQQYVAQGVASESPRGKRMAGPLVADSKQDYAVALKEQIQIRQMQKAAERAVDGAGIENPFWRPVDAAEDARSRQRRHPEQIAPPSKDVLAAALREQMAERNQQRDQERFHAQRPSANGDYGDLPAGELPVMRRKSIAPPAREPGAGDNPLVPGRRHLPPPAPSMQQGMQAAGPSGMTPRASRFARGGEALLGGGGGTPEPRIGMGAGAPERTAYLQPGLGGYGAGGGGGHASEQEGQEEADEHERAMIARVIAMRAAQAQQLLNDDNR